jgi:hypothetical protein
MEYGDQDESSDWGNITGCLIETGEAEQNQS